MNEIILTPILDWLDIAGIAVFALTGALVAAKEQQTFVTMAFFALVTGVGGGTVRDLLIDAPVFWITDPWVAVICLSTAVFAWFIPVRLWEGKLLAYADAVGLAAYAVLGSAKALAYGIPPVPAALMGIITGCVGGIIRDIVAGRPSIIMQPELYVTAAALGATMTVAGGIIAVLAGVASFWGWVAGFFAGFMLRAMAIRFELALPTYKGAENPPAPGGPSDHSSPGSGPPG